MTVSLAVCLLTKVVDQCSQVVKRIQFSVTSIKNVMDRELDAELSLFSIQLYHQPLKLTAAGYLDIDFEFVLSVSLSLS